LIAHNTYAQTITSTRMQNIYIHKIYLCSLPTVAIALLVLILQIYRSRKSAEK